MYNIKIKATSRARLFESISWLGKSLISPPIKMEIIIKNTHLMVIVRFD